MRHDLRIFSLSGLLVAFFLALVPNAASAAVQLIDKTRNELKNELYPVSDVLPGYKHPDYEVQKFAVTEFRVNNDELRVWSRVFAEVLRFRVQYIPGVRLYMPAPGNTHEDAQRKGSINKPLLTDQAAFKSLNSTLGIESVLTGFVEKPGDQYKLTVELIEAISGKEILSHQWEFTSNESGGVINEIAIWIYSSLGIELTPLELTYLNDEKHVNSEAINDFISNYSRLLQLEGKAKSKAILELQKKYPDFTLLAIYAMRNRTRAQNLDEAYRNLDLYKQLRELNPDNVGVGIYSYGSMDVDVMPNHEVSARLINMKNLVVENPHDPTIFVRLADTLIGNGSTLEGISILLEAVTRWPDNYRAWWSLGWALNQHAWQVRGDSFWKHVPERAKTQFRSLTILADATIDKALKLNNRNGGLWNMKLNSLGSVDGYSSKIIETFDTAIEFAPTDQRIYNSAMNYSADKWGGNARSRQYIIKMAIQNNPEEIWPEVLQQRYQVSLEKSDGEFQIKDIEYGIDNLLSYLQELDEGRANLKYFVMIIIVVLWLTYSFGKWIGRRELDAYQDEEDEYDSHSGELRSSYLSRTRPKKSL